VKGSYQAHQNLLKNIKVTVQKRFINVRLFDQHVGLFFKSSILNEKIDPMRHALRIGTVGMPDMMGFISNKNGLAIFLGIEVKSGNAKQTKEQKRFMKMVRSMGGIYIVGRSSEQVIYELEKAGF
jgi:hypothetical protein